MSAPDAPVLDRVRDLHERAVAANSALRPRAAQRHLDAALALLGPDAATDDELAVARAKVVITLAKTVAELHGFTAGLDLLDDAAAQFTPAVAPLVLTALHNQRGVLLGRLGRFADALDEFDAGERHFATAPGLEVANVLLNRGTVHMMAGARRAAESDLERCAVEAQAAGLALVASMALHNRAYLSFVRGDLPAALGGMIEAASLGVAAEGVSLLDRARVLIEAGLIHDADRTLAEAAVIFARDRSAQDLAETVLERARCALALGDADAAGRLARDARNRFRRRGNDRWRRAAELVVLHAELSAGRAPARVATAAELLARELADDRLRLPARTAALIAAEAWVTSGRVVAALAALASLGPARHEDPITGRAHAQYVRARVDAALDRRAAATRRIHRALDELARYQASFGSIDLRTASAVHGRRLAELDIALALDGGRPAAIFAAAERARAVSSRLAAVHPPDDPETAELLAELRQVVEALRTVEQDRRASAPLLRRRRELERQVRARTWAVSGDGAAGGPASLDQLRARLAERGRALVSYLQVGGRLAAVTVGERVGSHELGPASAVVEAVRRIRADLDVLAQPRLPAPLRGAARASLDRGLGELDAALRGPLAGSTRPLVIVSTGVLGQVPWASLPSLRGRSIVVAPSATKWLAGTAQSAVRRARVVAVAGPDLARAADEAAAVATTWPTARLLNGAQATAAAFVAAASESDVLHVAAHGVHQPENPLFSSVRMADGPVFAHELERHGQAPEHVVLSACEVGLATIRPGDEALGLASVLLNLGTRSVIAGVARVGDEVAAVTMARYHARLAGGTDSAAALAAALTEVDTDVVPPFVNFGAAWAPDLAAAEPVT